MIKCEMSKNEVRIQLKGGIILNAVEFEELCKKIREVMCAKLGDVIGEKLFDECISNSKMSEEEHERHVADLVSRFDDEVKTLAKYVSPEVMKAMFGED